MFRRGPAIVLSLVLSAAALAVAPSAQASDGGTAKENNDCDGPSSVKIKAEPNGSDRFDVTGVVYSRGDDTWEWRFKHEEDLSFKGEAKADGDPDGKSFRVTRTMVNFSGAQDHFTFRAENEKTGEVCRVSVDA
jgi:hypothetical protein